MHRLAIGKKKVKRKKKWTEGEKNTFHTEIILSKPQKKKIGKKSLKNGSAICERLETIR